MMRRGAANPPGQPGSPQTGRLAGEDEERRLEGVLGVVKIPADAGTRPENGLRVPAEEQVERRRVALREALDQLSIGHAEIIDRRNPGEQRVQRIPVPALHGSSRGSTLLEPRSLVPIRLFLGYSPDLLGYWTRQTQRIGWSSRGIRRTARRQPAGRPAVNGGPTRRPGGLAPAATGRVGPPFTAGPGERRSTLLTVADRRCCSPPAGRRRAARQPFDQDARNNQQAGVESPSGQRRFARVLWPG